jgi:rhodanese-related sulfurtransferase
MEGKIKALKEDDMAEKISVDTLKEWLDDPQVLILDVRAAKDWEASQVKIRHAVKRDPMQVQSWAGELPKGKQIVLYCA